MIKDFLLKFSSEDKLVAIKTNDNSFSYKDLFVDANLLASSLNKILPESDKYVPILISNSVRFIEVILALWRLGKCPVPFNLRWTSNEIEEIIQLYNFRFIIYEKELIPELKSTNIQKIEIDNLSKESLIIPTFECNIEAEGLVIFTSGSSTKPKGVVHSFNSLFNSVFNAQEILKLQPGDKILASLPFYHIGGFQIITRALINGCEIIIPKDLSIASIYDAIKIFSPNHLSLVSTQLKRLIELNLTPDKSIKSTLVGGGFIEDDLIIRASKEGWNPLRVYGSSETCSFITAANAKEIKSKPNTVGKSLKNCEIKISNEGEILISSNSLFKGYLTKDLKIEKAYVNNFYASEDIGYLDNDGYLFIEAKRTDLIITGGENVNPFEVENQILKIDGVQEVCVFPKSDKEWGQIIAAAIVTNRNLSDKDLSEFLRERLSGFKIPKKFYFTDSLPKTSIDKIDRKKIIELYKTSD